MSTINEDVREAVIRAIYNFENAQKKRSKDRNRKRPITSPEARQRAIERATRWNQENRERKNANNRNYGKLHAAANSKRYRDKKKGLPT